MNELVIKRAIIFSLIFGAVLGLLASIPTIIGICVAIVTFFASPIVILYMKKNEKYLNYLDNEKGAILGSIIGFSTGLGFFITFTLMVCILSLIMKIYSYGIPYIISNAFWLYLIIIIMVSAIFAMINAASGMGIIFLINRFSKKPQEYDAPLDIKIED